MNKNISQKQDEDEKKEQEAPVKRTRRGRSRRRGDINHQASNAWLLTFTDLAALMLTFFVLLYAMSEPEVKSFNEIMSALKREFHNFYGPRESAGPNADISIEKIPLNRALNLDYLNSLLVKHMKNDLEEQTISIQQYDSHLVVSLPQDVLFESGAAEMKEAGRKTLFSLANVFRRIRNRIEIVGHTDPAPITNPNSSFPSNWELSLERASSVAGILYRVGYRRPVLVRGYSSVQFRNLDQSVDEAVRNDFSRRVDLHIMTDDGSISLKKRLNLR